jgi:hypothetical protein
VWGDILQAILSSVLSSAAGAGVNALMSNATARPAQASPAGAPPAPPALPQGAVINQGGGAKPVSSLNFTGGFTGTPPGNAVGNQGSTGDSKGFTGMDTQRILGMRQRSGFEGI